MDNLLIRAGGHLFADVPLPCAELYKAKKSLKHSNSLPPQNQLNSSECSLYIFLSSHLPNLINLKVYSTTMKLFYSVAVSMFFANSVIQMAAGLKCSSGCAACWLDNNSNGVDTKFTCTGDQGVHCGGACPSGYNGIHCADIDRCL